MSTNFIKRFKTSDLIRSFTILFIIFFIFLYFSLNHFTSFNDIFSSSSTSSAIMKEESDEEFMKRRKAADAAKRSLERFSALNGADQNVVDVFEIEDEAFDIKTEDDKFCQASPRNCYSPRCYSPMNFFKGGCIGSPYAYKSPSKCIPDEMKKNSLHTKTPKDPMYFECPNRVDEREKISQFADHRDEKHSTAQDALENPQIGIDNFKYQTSWMYPKWFDWNGKCIRADRKNLTKYVDDQFTMRGLHHKKDGLYRLHNVCIKGNSSLPGPTFVGYVPKSRRGWEIFEPWRGADDTFHATKRLEPGLQHYISNSHEIFHGSDLPGACYLDTKVMLFPISVRIDNLGHALHRFGSALRVIESAFGKEEAEAKKNVTIMYLATDGEGKGVIDKNVNAMNALYEALGTSWFSVVGPQDVVSALKPPKPLRGTIRGEAAEAARLISLQHFQHDIDPSKYTCFKEIILWQNSYVPIGSHEFGMSSAMIQMKKKDIRNNSRSNPTNNNNKTRNFEEVRGLYTGARDTPGAQTSFQIHGPRTSRDVETAEIINERLRECGKLPPRRKMRKPTDPVKILFLVRREWRKLLLQPYMIGYMGRIIEDLKRQCQVNKNNNKKKSGGEPEFPGMEYSLQVAEMRSFTNFRDLIQLYSETDVIIGMYGAALTFSLFMPPGSLTIEFNFPIFRYAEHSGLNRNPTSEFGGNSLISGIHHLTFSDQGQLFRKTHLEKPGAFELLIGRPFVDFIFEKMECLMFYGNYSNRRKYRLASSSANSSSSYDSIMTPEFVIQQLDKHSRQPVMQTAPMSVRESLLPIPSTKCRFVEHDYYLLSSKTTIPPNLPLLVAEAASIHLKKSEDEYPLSASRHLRSIIKYRDIVAVSIQKYIEPSRFSMDATVRILIVEACEARHSVLAESSFWRMLFARTNEIVVAEFAAGKKACDELKRRRMFQMRAKHQEEYDKNASLSKSDQTAKFNPNTAPQHPLDIINAKTKLESDSMVHVDGGLREYYIKFCDYPCRHIGLFNFIVHDCLIPEDCVVKFRASQDEHDQAREHLASKNRLELASKSILLMPSATDVFRSRAIGKTAVLFGFLQTPITSNNHNNNNNNNNDNAEQKNDRRRGTIDVPDLFISRSAGAQAPSSNSEVHNPTVGAESLKEVQREDQTLPPSQKHVTDKPQHRSSKLNNNKKKLSDEIAEEEAEKKEEDEERPGHHQRKYAHKDKYGVPTRRIDRLNVVAADDENDVKLSRKKAVEDERGDPRGRRMRGR